MRIVLRILILGLLIPGVGAGVGCISAVPPRVDVVGARVTEATTQGASMEVALVLTNPNDVALPLPETSYTVSVAGVGSFSAIDLPARIIAPNGTQSLTLPAAIATDGQDLAGRDWTANGTVTYNPDNGVRRFLTETGVPLPVAFFGGEGTFE